MLSVYAVYKVLLRAGEIKPRRRRPRKKPVYYQMKGQRVQVDVKYMPTIRLRDRPEPYREYQYSAIDDGTRLRFAWVYQSNSVDFACKMMKFFPFPVEEVQTDHGKEFTYIFMSHVQKPHPFEGFLSGKAHSYCYSEAERQGREVTSHR